MIRHLHDKVKNSSVGEIALKEKVNFQSNMMEFGRQIDVIIEQKAFRSR